MIKSQRRLNNIVSEPDDIMDEALNGPREKISVMQYVKEAAPYALLTLFFVALGYKALKQEKTPEYVRPDGGIFEEELYPAQD